MVGRATLLIVALCLSTRATSSELGYRDLDGDGFPGTRLYYPSEDHNPRPVVVMLHGSEGGSEKARAYWLEDAKRLVAAGFAAAFYCYYGCPGRPGKLYEIPLGGVLDLIKFLKTDEQIAAQKVGLFGRSRGAEMALLLASKVHTTEMISAVAVHAPSNRIVSAFDPQKINQVDASIKVRRDGRLVNGPAWSWGGEKIWGDEGLTTPGPLIKVEEYQGPLFLSQGTEDGLAQLPRGGPWDHRSSLEIKAVRDKTGELETGIYIWPGEGHSLSKDTLQTMYNQMIPFFKTHLGGKGLCGQLLTEP